VGNHPTVHLAGPTGDVEIDVELAPAIAALWKLGVATRQCCQYNELSDSAEISFPTTSDMAAFVGAVFPVGYDESDEMQDRISDWEVHDPASSRLRLGWRWIVAPEWDGVRWDFAGRVEFPASHLPTVIERLQRTTARA
jgi:hypothetical protein